MCEEIDAFGGYISLDNLNALRNTLEPERDITVEEFGESWEGVEITSHPYQFAAVNSLLQTSVRDEEKRNMAKIFKGLIWHTNKNFDRDRLSMKVSSGSIGTIKNLYWT